MEQLLAKQEAARSQSVCDGAMKQMIQLRLLSYYTYILCYCAIAVLHGFKWEQEVFLWAL